MKVFELLFFNKELLNNFKRAGVRCEDVGYLDMYSEYSQMRKNKEKVSYIVATLAEKYAISERSVYTIIKRLDKDCNSLAVQSFSESNSI